MKRYFMVHDQDMPGLDLQIGHWHFIALDGHGPNGADWNLVCLEDGHVKPPIRWLAFPPLYDASTTLATSPVLQAHLADIGLKGEETCLQAVVRLGEIHPGMGL